MFNWLKTAILMAGITALFGAVGASIGGETGMLLALAFALLSNVFAYWFSDRMVLKMYNAREVDETSAPLELEAPPLQAFLEQLSLVGDADALGLPNDLAAPGTMPALIAVMQRMGGFDG